MTMPSPDVHARTQPLPVQLFDLTLVQLANWRWAWRSALLISLIAPGLSIAALGAFVKGQETDVLGYVLTGNLVMSLLFGTFDQVAGHFAYMRMVGRLDFFAMLPIYRVTLVLATVIAFLLLALPAAALTLALGVLILDLTPHFSPWIVLVVPITGMSLCGLGTIIGLIVRTPEEVGYLSTMTTFLMLGFGPVVLPPDRLPGIVNTLSYLSPATYAASALRQTVLGMPGRLPLAVDLAVLALFLAVSLWIVEKHLDWQRA